MRSSVPSSSQRAEVVVHRAARRQVLRQRRPLAAGAQDIHHPVHHLAHVDRPLVAAALGRRDQRPDQRPFLVRQVARIAQLAAVVSGAVLGRPHPAAPANRGRRAWNHNRFLGLNMFLDGHLSVAFPIRQAIRHWARADRALLPRTAAITCRQHYNCVNCISMTTAQSCSIVGHTRRASDL